MGCCFEYLKFPSNLLHCVHNSEKFYWKYIIEIYLCSYQEIITYLFELGHTQSFLSPFPHPCFCLDFPTY